MIPRYIVLLAALAAATPACAQNIASFVVPNDDGYGVDACLESGNACGQPIATEWCVANGYSRAINYRQQTAADITGSIRQPTEIAAAQPHAIVITCEK
ncbi:hypothetical protein [Labrys monachus]|uniref:Uncharacterized protein n=1 Tax=Labrys monachus TaxID=217067 RepID=A0ABU0FJN4_9HYPH|nr:hypothetical protein [Labrys monachus]MDQ0394260.1 hypothetical protein [Labrys monachus]